MIHQEQAVERQPAFSSSIVDLTGKTVMRRSLSPGLHQLRVDELPAGVYVVEVRIGGVRGVRRLVVG